MQHRLVTRHDHGLVTPGARPTTAVPTPPTPRFAARFIRKHRHEINTRDGATLLVKRQLQERRAGKVDHVQRLVAGHVRVRGLHNVAAHHRRRYRVPP